MELLVITVNVWFETLAWDRISATNRIMFYSCGLCLLLCVYMAPVHKTLTSIKVEKRLNENKCTFSYNYSNKEKTLSTP